MTSILCNMLLFQDPYRLQTMRSAIYSSSKIQKNNLGYSYIKPGDKGEKYKPWASPMARKNVFHWHANPFRMLFARTAYHHPPVLYSIPILYSNNGYTRA